MWTGKVDPKQPRVMGKLAAAENCVFTTLNETRKRYGADAMPQNILGGATSITVGQGLTTYGGELVCFDPSNLYSFSEANDAWVKKGTLLSAVVDQYSVNRDANQQTAQDSAVHPSGLAIYAWEDSSGGVKYTIVDTASDQMVVHSDVLADANAIKPKCLVMGPLFVILIEDSSTFAIKAYTIGVGNPSGTPTATSIVSDLNHTHDNWDATVMNGQVCILYNSSTSTTIGAAYLTQSLANGFTAAISTDSATGCINVAPDETMFNQMVVTYYNGTAVKSFVINNFGQSVSLVVLVAKQTIETVSNVFNIAAYFAGGVAQIYYTIYNSANPAYNALIHQNTLTGATPGTATVFIRSLSIAAKPFFYNSQYFLPCAFTSGNQVSSPTTPPLQNTYFLLNGNAQVVAKMLSTTGGGIGTRNMVPETNTSETGIYQMALLVQDQLESITGNAVAQPILSSTGVSNTVINFFDPVTSYTRAQLGNVLTIGGGFVAQYDSGTVCELGFHLFPEQPTWSVGDSGSTFSYQYWVVYEWTNAQGGKEQSSPSIAITAAKRAAAQAAAEKAERAKQRPGESDHDYLMRRIRERANGE